MKMKRIKVEMERAEFGTHIRRISIDGVELACVGAELRQNGPDRLSVFAELAGDVEVVVVAFSRLSERQI